MLILTRAKGESIIIGEGEDRIKIIFLGDGNLQDEGKFGIEGPKNIIEGIRENEDG